MNMVKIYPFHCSRLKAVVIAAGILFLQTATSGPPDAESAENGETFMNPVIFADYSDPDVIRLEDDFYLVSSSFAHTPGLPILHSRDLVNWEIIVYAVQNLPDPIFEKPQHGKGIWAPSIRFQNGEFRIYYGDPDLGILMVKARNPEGPWKTPALVKAAKGWIDPCPFWDDDGNAYLVHAWAESRAGFNSILTIHRMSPDGTKILDEGQTVFDGHAKHPTIEGPKLYKRNGYYYVFAPAGGVRNGWQTVLRSKNIYGPYEDKIVLEQGGTATNGPHQGAWVELESGESWFVHFQDRDAYGRIVHLQSMRWQDDWPVIGEDFDGNGIGEPVAAFRKPDVAAFHPEMSIRTSDDFDDEKLGLQWQWQANYKESWYSLNAASGSLRLYSVNPVADGRNLWDLPNIIAQKFPAEAFEAVTRVSFHPENEDDRTGLIVLGSDYAALTVSPKGTAYRLNQIECRQAAEGQPEIVNGTVVVDSPGVYLKVTVRPDALCTFAYSLDGRQFIPTGTEFQAVKGKWVGAKIGLFATIPTDTGSTGYADFDFFHLKINGTRN